MACNYNPATGEVETLLERYQREAEAEQIIEERARMAQAMKAVDEVSKQRYRTAMTFGVVKK